jgi:hypothetical protein
MIKTQFTKKIRILRSDNAKEYTSSSFASYLFIKGIIHQTSCAHTLQQNGVVEHKNHNLLDVACCLLFYMHVPKHFWSDIVLTACYLINRMPSSVLDGASPHSPLYCSSPHLPYHLGFLGVFVMFIIWVLVMINLILVLLNVSFLVISQLRKNIIVIALFFAATLLVLMSHLLSLFSIFLLMCLLECLP